MEPGSYGRQRLQDVRGNEEWVASRRGPRRKNRNAFKSAVLSNVKLSIEHMERVEMEARSDMVLNDIARSIAPGGLKRALSFRVVELVLRDDGAVGSIPQARGEQWPLQQRLVPEMVEQLVKVPRRDPVADCRSSSCAP